MIESKGDATAAPLHLDAFAIGGDLPVVRLGYGAMQITGPGVWGPPRDHDEVIRVLRRAVELGVTLIDTADSYGPEVSERLIREALHPYPDDLVIATKAGFTRPGPGRWERNGKPEYLKAQAEKSLRLLGLERISFLPWYPMATGRLARPGGPLQQIADEHAVTPAQLALAWLLQRSPVVLPIPGTSTVAHLEENVDAARIELTPDQVRQLNAVA
jgi:aryl-alcohol dehydrogenase-like predicted oxidoreductase